MPSESAASSSSNKNPKKAGKPWGFMIVCLALAGGAVGWSQSIQTEKAGQADWPTVEAVISDSAFVSNDAQGVGGNISYTLTYTYEDQAYTDTRSIAASAGGEKRRKANFDNGMNQVIRVNPDNPTETVNTFSNFMPMVLYALAAFLLLMGLAPLWGGNAAKAAPQAT
jgi:hypothetical protein